MNKVFVISLERSQERRQAVAKELEQKNINFEFFDAVDGKACFPWQASDYDFTKRLWFTSGKMPTSGEIGCYASHYLLWVKCIELNQPIIIIEDDVRLAENAKDIIKLALEKIGQYQFLRLEPIEENGEEIHSVEDVNNVKISLMKKNLYGARAYAISPQAAIKLIKHRWYVPVDTFIGATYIHNQYSYLLEPSLIAGHGMHTSTITEEVDKTPIYRKLTRELYTLYKRFMLTAKFKTKIKSIEAAKRPLQ